MLGKYATTLSSDKLNVTVSSLEDCITSDIYKFDKVRVCAIATIIRLAVISAIW